MSEMTAMPILTAPPPAAVTGAAAPPSAAHGGAGVARDGLAAAASAGAATAAGDQDASRGALPAAGGDSFATVLGRQLAKGIADPNGLPGTTAAISATALAAAPADATAAAADPGEKESDEEATRAEDGMAAGIASLLPLLQSLLPGAAGATRVDAKADTTLVAKRDAKQGVVGLQAAPLQAEAATEERAAAGQRSLGDSKGTPPQTLLGDSKGTQAQAALAAGEGDSSSKGAAANPAASALVAEVTSSNKSIDGPAPEASFANLLAAAQAPAQSPVNRASTPLAIEAPVGSRHWDSHVGEKLVWMVSHQEQHADLVLNPPQLGKVEVSISVNGDQASAQFVSANPAVRDALEAAMPRLREMLADAGLNLGQAQVGSGSAQNASGNSANNQENSDNSRRGSGVAGQVEALGQVGAPGTWLRAGKGMVDVFA